MSTTEEEFFNLAAKQNMLNATLATQQAIDKAMLTSMAIAAATCNAICKQLDDCKSMEDLYNCLYMLRKAVAPQPEFKPYKEFDDSRMFGIRGEG